MKLTKYEHACVVLEKDNTAFVIDPGTFSSGAAGIIADAEAVLLTHEHFDHVNEEAISAALASRPGLRVYGPASLADKFGAQYTTVAPGDGFDIGSFHITVHGGEHALIHRDIPVVANVGFLVDESVYHPGDAYYVPQATIATLLVPTSGPWAKLGETADFIRAVHPEQSVQIHEFLFSPAGLGLAANYLGKDGLTGVPFTSVAVGDSITV